MVTALPAVVIFLILLRLSGQRLLGEVRRAEEEPAVKAAHVTGLAYAAAFFGFTVVFGANVFTLPGRMGMSATVLVVAAMSSVSLPESNEGNLLCGANWRSDSSCPVPASSPTTHSMITVAMAGQRRSAGQGVFLLRLPGER